MTPRDPHPPDGVAPLDRVVAGLRCRDVLAALSDFVDGTLEAADRARVVAHLDGCDRCARFGGGVVALLDALRAGLAEPPPIDVGIAARLAARLARETGAAAS